MEVYGVPLPARMAQFQEDFKRPAPYNYTLNAIDPRARLLEGLQVGQDIKATRDKRKLAIQAAEYQAETTKMLGALGPKSTAQDHIAIGNRMDPKNAEKIRENFKLGNAEKQKNTLTAISQIMVAFKVDPKISIRLVGE